MLSMVAHQERAGAFAIQRGHNTCSAEQDGIKFLGSPFGKAFAAALLDKRVTKKQLLINKLMKQDDKQVASSC
jgi:hypothetical protein